jgi:1,2-diacylglycerol 3-beta-galactosyltransferase
MKKVLLIMIEAGGGHRASAKAITEGLAYLYGDEILAKTVDISKEYAFSPLLQSDEAYRWLTSDGIWMWKAFWHTDEKAWVPQFLSAVLTPLFSREVRRLFLSEKPDMVVSVHCMSNHIPLRVLRKELRVDIPFVTVVTDMVTVHPIWICPDVDYCIVPTEAARERALRFGMPPERLEVIGQPVSLKFAAGLGDKEALRRRLNLDLRRPCALIVGGGDGVGPIYEIARAIATTASNVQLIVVAGRNTTLRRELECTAWEIPTRVCGFVNNMPELMGASDLLITKAGPGTLAEAFIARLPVVVYGFIPGQEEGNVRYVQEHNAGAFTTDPASVAQVARDWLRPGNDEWRHMVDNAAALARPDAALVIAERLHDLLERRVERNTVWPAPSPLRRLVRRLAR